MSKTTTSFLNTVSGNNDTDLCGSLIIDLQLIRLEVYSASVLFYVLMLQSDSYLMPLVISMPRKQETQNNNSLPIEHTYFSPDIIISNKLEAPFCHTTYNKMFANALHTI